MKAAHAARRYRNWRPADWLLLGAAILDITLVLALLVWLDPNSFGLVP